MELSDFIGSSIDETLILIKKSAAIVKYSKIEGTEFIEVPEHGYYLQSNDGTGVISEYRVYVEKYGDFFPSSSALRGAYLNLKTVADAEILFGSAIKDVRSIKIPGAKPTLPGKVFIYKKSKIIAYTNDGVNITCLHFKQLAEE